MREKNKAIIEAIKNELSKYDGSTPVEILVKFINHGRIEHGVLNYFTNMSGDWLGTMGSMFDFDFFATREVIVKEILFLQVQNLSIHCIMKA